MNLWRGNTLEICRKHKGGLYQHNKLLHIVSGCTMKTHSETIFLSPASVWVKEESRAENEMTRWSTVGTIRQIPAGSAVVASLWWAHAQHLVWALSRTGRWDWLWGDYPPPHPHTESVSADQREKEHGCRWGKKVVASQRLEQAGDGLQGSQCAPGRQMFQLIRVPSSCSAYVTEQLNDLHFSVTSFFCLH